ncbi:hypothetical protein JCM19237_5411 [Photobacterium aphoticum]|uniref:Uncharacterized protein n=1 Tax=Photobacterium aphoticum TaxID=754436 RepID=A0A090QJW2_9GAMM|nr:hypothetical protein JCM19237_5411 [Photobacterium aphoticum]
MTSLEHLFLQFGIQAVAFTDNERQYAQDFLQQRETTFNAICAQRTDKQPSDLALGLMTQSFQTTFEAYQATASKIAEMQQLFERQVGDTHASKFHTLDAMELKVVTALWLLTQAIPALISVMLMIRR